MKKKLKFLPMISAIVLLSGILTSCEGNSGDKYKIGVIQLVEHDALDSAYRGFAERLEQKGFKNGENIAIDYRNAQGDQSNCFTAASSLVSNGSNLIFAISTPAAQAAANATKVLPVFFTAVTDPVSANLVKTETKPAGNVTGTSDLAPVEKQISLLKRLFPKTEKLGILYCSNETNSKHQADIAISGAKKHGMDAEIFTVSQINEIDRTVAALVAKCDAVYTPTDNMMASAMPTISNIATPMGIPIICGESNVVSKGALGTYGMDYRKLGALTADMAISVINGEKSPSELSVAHLEDTKLTLNSDIIKRLGIQVPDDLMREAQMVNTDTKQK